MLFIKWRLDSQNFQTEYKKYNRDYRSIKGRKSFLSPYIAVDLKNTLFKLVLPPQLIKLKDDNINLYWCISIDNHVICKPVMYYEAITGYKTMEMSIELLDTDVFNTITVKLLNNSEKVNSYKEIKSDCVRFFDEDGDFLRANTLPIGKVFAYTQNMSHISSPGLVNNEPRYNLTLFYFEFQSGDIVRLPDGKVLSIGKEIEEGLSQRSLVSDAYVQIEQDKLPIYNKAPNVIMRIAKNKVNGTMLIVNDTKRKLFDMETIEIQLQDKSGEIGYLINLADYGCDKDGLYSVIIDVPNDKKYRHWDFALITGLYYEFEDAPYIFNTKGTISFSKDIYVRTIDNLNKNQNENSFNFELSPASKDLCFEKVGKPEIKFYIRVPVLKWKFESGNWEILKPDSIWYTDFPKVISIDCPGDIISICMNEEMDTEEEEEPKNIVFSKNKQLELFICDVTRVLSWFNREQTYNTIYITLNGKQILFINVITKSEVSSCFITADYENRLFKGYFIITGYSEYYVDISFRNEIICDKIPIINGELSVPMRINSGKYKITVYESEEDDTGFGYANYFLINSFENELINPYNLEGKTLKIIKIKRSESSIFTLSLSMNYIITDFCLENQDCLYRYTGTMVIKNHFNGILGTLPVLVEFYDLNKLHVAFIGFIDDGEVISFLYDNNQKNIVTYEEVNLPPSIKYRRYEDLYDGGYYFIIEFINKN